MPIYRRTHGTSKNTWNCSPQNQLQIEYARAIHNSHFLFQNENDSKCDELENSKSINSFQMILLENI